MRYAIQLAASVEKALTHLPGEIQKRIAKKIDLLARTPRPSGCEKLEGEDELWRVRVGDYRIVYSIEDKVLIVLVLRVAHRREVYRR